MPVASDQELNEIIGMLARAARIQAGLTQAAAAAASGVNQSMISHIEHGRSTATVVRLLMLAAAYGVEMDAFFPPSRYSIADARRFACERLARAKATKAR